MDEKDKIIQQPNQLEDDGEQISLSVSLNQGCSIYICLDKGLMAIRKDYHDANAVRLKLKEEPEKNKDTLAAIDEQIQVMKLCLENSVKFKKELGELIQELHEPKNKIIIPKPKF